MSPAKFLLQRYKVFMRSLGHMNVSYVTKDLHLKMVFKGTLGQFTIKHAHMSVHIAIKNSKLSHI